MAQGLVERGVLAAVIAVVCAASAGASAAAPVMVISAAEAKLPDAPDAQPQAARGRGLFAPPDVTLVAPASGQSGRGPLLFSLRFKPHNGAAIDPASVRVTYLKSPHVDLTERLKPYMSADGVTVPEAEFAPGRHVLQVDVADTDQHVRHALIELNASGN